MTDSELDDMYTHLVFKCRSFEKKKEYVVDHPELYTPTSLVTLDSIIEKSEKSASVMLRLHRNLLSELESRGIDETFLDYGYVDPYISQLFFQLVTDSSDTITASSIIAMPTLGELDNSTKIKLINWFIAGYPRSKERAPNIKAIIGLREDG